MTTKATTINTDTGSLTLSVDTFREMLLADGVEVGEVGDPVRAGELDQWASLEVQAWMERVGAEIADVILVISKGFAGHPETPDEVMERVAGECVADRLANCAGSHDGARPLRGDYEALEEAFAENGWSPTPESLRTFEVHFSEALEQSLAALA